MAFYSRSVLGRTTALAASDQLHHHAYRQTQEPGAAERQSTGALQNLQDRIKYITLDMDALNRSWSAETTVGFAPTGSLEKSANDLRFQLRGKSR